MNKLLGQISQLGMGRALILNSSYNTMVQAQPANQRNAGVIASLEDRCSNQGVCQYDKDAGGMHKYQIGVNLSRKDKIEFLVNTLLDIKDSKEAVYGVLDAWVAWEENFPIASLKRVLSVLEKEQQWHRIVQVIKWMLSKGQGTTLNTYGQLIRALEKDHRAEEAEMFWAKRISVDLHSVPWNLCRLMISVYYRNNMLENLVKLFKGLEAFGRKPPEKSIAQRVADAYEILGLRQEKEKVLEKYSYLFTETSRECPKKSGKAPSKRIKRTGRRKGASTLEDS